MSEEQEQEQELDLISGLDALAEVCSLQAYEPVHVPIPVSNLNQIGGAIRLLLQRKDSSQSTDGENVELQYSDVERVGRKQDESEPTSRNQVLERTIIIGGILGTIFSMLNTEFNKMMASTPQSNLIFDRPDFNYILTPEEQQVFCATFGEFFTESVNAITSSPANFLNVVAETGQINTITIGNEVITIKKVDSQDDSPTLQVMLSIAGADDVDITERLKLIPGQPKLNGYKVTAWCAARISTIHFELLKWGDLVGSKDDILNILKISLPQSHHEERMNTAFEYALYGYEEAAKLGRQMNAVSDNVSRSFRDIQEVPSRVFGYIPSQDQVELYIARNLPVLWPVLILTKDYPLHALFITLLVGYLLRNEIRTVSRIINNFITGIKSGITSVTQSIRLTRNGGRFKKLQKILNSIKLSGGGDDKSIPLNQPHYYILNHLTFLTNSINEKTTELLNEKLSLVKKVKRFFKQGLNYIRSRKEQLIIASQKKRNKGGNKKTQRNNRRRTYKKTRR
jgi:hypothetical protein